MSIGFGIFLFVVGAIVTFALNFTVDWINLDLVGYLLMGAGVIVTIIGIVAFTRRRKTVVTEHVGVDPASGQRVQQRSTSVSGDELP